MKSKLRFRLKDNHRATPVNSSSEKCNYCHQPLVVLIWNHKGNLAVCNTFDCPLYRQPQKYLLKEV